MPESTHSPMPNGEPGGVTKTRGRANPNADAATPFITEENVSQALDALLFTATPHPRALNMLALVDEVVSNPSLPASSRPREFAMTNLLLDMITQELMRLRRVVHPEDQAAAMTPTGSSLLEDELPRMRLDMASGSYRLMAWSFLYYRYVRVDLNVTPEKLGEWTGLDARTLRRYRTRALRELTHKLIQAEWDARERQRRRRLLGRLPSATPVRLFGREEAFDRAEALLTQHRAHHLLVVGAPGVGKTVFVQEFIRRQINRSALEAAVWIASPETAEQVMRQLEDGLLANPVPRGTASQTAVRDVLMSYRVAIILDDVQLINRDDLDRLLGYLSPALVCITSPAFVALRSPVEALVLHDLDRDAIRAYVHHMRQQSMTETQNDDDSVYIEARVGGNPLAIKLALDALGAETDLLVTHEPLETLFDKRYRLLTWSQRRAWYAVAITADSGLTLDELLTVWGDVTRADAAALLVHHLILLDDERRVGLSSTIVRYLQNKLAPDHLRVSQEPETLVRDLVSDLARFVDANPRLPLSALLVETVLVAQWIPVDEEVRERWMRLLLGSPAKSPQRWYTILERAYHAARPENRLPLDYLLEFGALLRRYTYWSASQQILEQAIAAAGHVGDFVKQGYALMELSITLRTRGLYDQSLRLIESARKIAERYHNGPLRHAVLLELAQIAVDMRDGALALKHLRETLDTGRSLALQGEAHLRLDNPDEGLAAAFRAVRIYDEARDPLNSGRTHILIGRLYLMKSMYRHAHDHLTTALTLLELHGDPFALARAQCNLATVLIFQGHHREADRLLAVAAQAQERMGDTVGLTVTQHNMRWLASRIAR